MRRYHLSLRLCVAYCELTSPDATAKAGPSFVDLANFFVSFVLHFMWQKGQGFTVQILVFCTVTTYPAMGRKLLQLALSGNERASKGG